MKAQKRFSRIVCTVIAEILIASGIFLKSEETIVIPATSMAISLPLPMAMLRSASARAALSFIPSPTIATVFPEAFRLRI